MEKNTSYCVGPQTQSLRDPQTFCKSIWQSYTPPCTPPSFSSINYQRFTSAFRHLRRDELQRCQPPILKGKDLTELRHPDGHFGRQPWLFVETWWRKSSVKEVQMKRSRKFTIFFHKFAQQVSQLRCTGRGIFVWVGSARPKTATFGCGGSPSCRNGRPTASKESLGRGVA